MYLKEIHVVLKKCSIHHTYDIQGMKEKLLIFKEYALI
jgi:hypothetical protein